MLSPHLIWTIFKSGKRGGERERESKKKKKKISYYLRIYYIVYLRRGLAIKCQYPSNL